jgi:dipeptidyl aminopeptidase/acylaminoacyl peptidase
VVVACPRDDPGARRDLVPPGFNVRSRAHEYGGGAYCTGFDGLFFVEDSDQRVYRTGLNGADEEAAALTPASGDESRSSYADLVPDVSRRRLLAVREQHRPGREPRASLVAIDVDGGPLDEVFAGPDFLASPRLSPDGRQLAWLSWSHPDMPWDASRLWLAGVRRDGSLDEPRCVAGCEDESIFQPEWSPDGRLHFVSDRTGWWNLYRLDDSGETVALCPREQEFGLPQWVFRMSTYALPAPGRMVCTWCDAGVWHLGHLDKGSRLRHIPTDFTLFESLQPAPGGVVLLAASPSQGPTVLFYDLERDALSEVHRLSQEEPQETTLSIGEPISFPTSDGATAHAFYYRPRNDDWRAPDGEKPPLLVLSHGGPTGMATNEYEPRIQFWTSRGFAVVDVNYRGSTGFGRDYRRALEGRWGVVDVDDCIAAADWLAERDEVDPDRLVIRGSSAGGYTTLAALAFRDRFRAGASHYGVGDLEALVRDTHKFEARYLDRLIGQWPEERERYRERSPVHAAEQLSCPVIFFQGLEDKVVPPNQAETMVVALRSKGVPVAHVTFAEEQHGFRRAENIQRALEAELSFYARLFAFTPADEIEPVEIEPAP